MKTVKVKTIIKVVLFVIIAGWFTYFLLSGDEEDMEITGPDTPVVEEPAGEDEAGDDAEDAEGELPPEEEPEQVEVDEEELEDLLEEEEERKIIIDSKQDEIEGHKFLTENDHFELYLKEENLSIILREKQTGAIMTSTVDEPVGSNESWQNFVRSGIVMEYIVGTNIVTYRADMYSQEPEKTVTETEDGFLAEIFYPELEIGFEVIVTLTDQGITVDIPQDSIVEENNQYRMASIYVYPFLGHTLLGDREGYMFIPDGSGALIYLNDKDGKYTQPYSVMVYGENVGIDDPYVLSLFNQMNPFNDPEKVLAPVFGMVHTDNEIGYLGIIEEGEFSARIEAYPNGAILPYNWITPKFIYRQVYNQPTSQDTGTMVVRQRNRNNFDIKVHYHFVAEEDANYMGLASTYRDYLLDNDLITVKEDQFNLRVDLLGAEVEQGLLFKSDVPMTTFSQAYDILTDIKDQGAENILSIYKGWNDKGYYGGLPIQTFNPESTLSDGTSIEELIEQLDEEQIDLFLYHDGLRINMDELGTTRHKIMKKFNRRTYKEEVHGKVYREFNYLHPGSTVKIMENMHDNYLNADIENIMISGISNTLFSYSEGNKEFDRISTKDYYEPVIESYADDFNLLLEQPFAYLWDQTEAMIDVPTRSSNYVFTDEDIPFLALTLKGVVPIYAEYVNFQANQEEFFLQMVEQGFNPSFLITHESPADLMNTNSSHIYSSQYERYQEMIQEYYQELSDVHNQTAGAVIVDYQRQGQTTRVSYDNGVDVLINYAEEPQTVNDHLIEPMSYKVVNN
ncbi:hypothetical protein KQI76_02750 [Amphibacillus sp. MSJ-3]|uniref:DUF5696 domain-containing protein n=1 Tax=Amphibacillus sp. MSJ-3 TaxID=2841505 RepID=UPI001C0EACBD|nr:DUF5696 domain-containing protein [Amphibacillus sp. MSJ-3]MBU5594073.1 hypothetical protein [Amphibacillus sp. MSJ-3]